MDIEVRTDETAFRGPRFCAHEMVPGELYGDYHLYPTVVYLKAEKTERIVTIHLKGDGIFSSDWTDELMREPIMVRLHPSVSVTLRNLL